MEVGRMNCPVCACLDPAPALRHVQPSFKDDLSATSVAYFSCPDYGLCFKAPAKEEELKDYYKNAWQYETPRPSECFSTAACWINKTIPKQTSAVDVGARDSELLGALGIDGDYFDPKVSPTGWVGGKGLHPPHTTHRQYGLVCATHVLEHVADPVRFLLFLRDMTLPMGFIYIEVPSLELGSHTAGVSDDINRNHLQHFSIPSLVTTSVRAGLHVLRAEADERVKDWPVCRILLSRYVPASSWIQGMASAQRKEYLRALDDLRSSDPAKVGLYGASGTLVSLMQMDPELVGQFRVFDLYKHGREIGGVRIEHPDEMPPEVYIVPRFWNSVQDIQSFLNTSYSTIIHLPLFKGCESNTQPSP